MFFFVFLWNSTEKVVHALIWFTYPGPCWLRIHYCGVSLYVDLDLYDVMLEFFVVWALLSNRRKLTASGSMKGVDCLTLGFQNDNQVLKFTSFGNHFFSYRPEINWRWATLLGIPWRSCYWPTRAHE